MQASELRENSDEELAMKERELKESLFLLRLRQKTNQLESSARLAQTRRDIARIKTIQRARELERAR
ncbi:MAG: 50S ribosomal protein L29 [Candidatus Binatia bacterium]|jgi:large subunit ribosomal protein L29